MTDLAWIFALAAGSGVVVAVLAWLHGQRNPLRVPLVLLAVDQFAWNAGSLGGVWTGSSAYSWVGAIAAPLFPTLAFDFVCAFVGKRRRLRVLINAAHVIFGAQALLAAAVWLVGVTAPWASLSTFAMVLLVTSVPVAIGGVWLVVRHVTNAPSAEEKRRGWLLLAALLIVSVLLPTDLLMDMGLKVPPLSLLGSCVFNTLLTLVMWRLDEPTHTERARAVLQAIAVSLTSVSVCLVLVLTFKERLGMLLVVLAVAAVLFAVLGRFAWANQSAAEKHAQRFSVLGRFSAQMAHDLKNPLAAARGAAEFLVEDLRRASLTQQEDFARLLLQQLDRLQSTIDRYQKLSKLEPERSSVNVIELVNDVASLQTFATRSDLKIATALPANALHASVDAALISSVLENLVKNASQAMPDGGTVTISAKEDPADVRTLVLSVKDTGPGMSPRVKDHAFEPFFTTKADGSGMGLAFVRDVAIAHGGTATLTSREGHGTEVELRIPMEEGTS